jgi:hypothetical protein
MAGNREHEWTKNKFNSEFEYRLAISQDPQPEEVSFVDSIRAAHSLSDSSTPDTSVRFPVTNYSSSTQPAQASQELLQSDIRKAIDKSNGKY